MISAKRTLMLAALAVGVAYGALSAVAQNGSPRTNDPQAEAFRAGGLKAAAAVTGSYMRTVQIREKSEPHSLADLARFSQKVVVGTAAANTSRMTPDGQSIFMYVDVQVESTLKGATPTATVTVIVPGGRVGFADGSWAQMNAAGFMWPINGRRYVWFLEAAPRVLAAARASGANLDSMFVPSHGPLGIYELASNGQSVKPSGLYRSAFAKSILAAGLSPDAFLARVNEAIER